MSSTTYHLPIIFTIDLFLLVKCVLMSINNGHLTLAVTRISSWASPGINYYKKSQEFYCSS